MVTYHTYTVTFSHKSAHPENAEITNPCAACTAEEICSTVVDLGEFGEMEFLSPASRSAPPARRVIVTSSAGLAAEQGPRLPLRPPPRPTASTEHPEYKGGMSRDEHHGARGDSPPGRHKALYDFLPNAKQAPYRATRSSPRDTRSASVPTNSERSSFKKLLNHHVPKRMVIEVSYFGTGNECYDTQSTQRLQPRIFGVYELIGYEKKAPVWKHCREDLVIHNGNVDGERGYALSGPNPRASSAPGSLLAASRALPHPPRALL